MERREADSLDVIVAAVQRAMNAGRKEAFDVAVTVKVFLDDAGLTIARKK